MQRTSPTYNDSTRAARLYEILSDGQWHGANELIRRVGPNFGSAKARLVYLGNVIEKRHQPGPRRQWFYRLVDEPNHQPAADASNREPPTDAHTRKRARLILKKTTTKVTLSR